MFFIRKFIPIQKRFFTQKCLTFNNKNLNEMSLKEIRKTLLKGEITQCNLYKWIIEQKRWDIYEQIHQVDDTFASIFPQCNSCQTSVDLNQNK